MTDTSEPTPSPNRRALVLGAVGLATAAGLGAAVFKTLHAAPGGAKTGVLKVGDQRGGTRALMEAAGALKDVPYKVEWAEMPAAAPLLEALSAGAIDLGGVGGAPFAFAYANGAKIKVVLASRIQKVTPETGRAAAILVSKHSKLKSVKDLVGRKLATIKGSAGHDTALRILEREGVDPRAVQFVYLSNGDAKAALASGSIDAWSTWATYVGIAVIEDGDRILADAVGLAEPGRISTLLAASDRAVAEKEPLLRDFLARYLRAREWARHNSDAYATALAKDTGVPVDVARYSTSTLLTAEFVPIDQGVLEEQRKTFARYVQAGVIDRIPPLSEAGYSRIFNDLVAAPSPPATS